MGEDELTPPRFLKKIAFFVSVLMKYYIQNVTSINIDSVISVHASCTCKTKLDDEMKKKL